MTYDPYRTPDGSQGSAAGEPAQPVTPSSTPPYQDGTTPGVPPYQPGPGVPPQASTYSESNGQGSYQQAGTNAGPFGQNAGPFGTQSGPSAPHASYQQGPYQQPGGYQQAPYSQPGAGAPLAPSEERTWSIFAHLASVIGAVLSIGLLNFLGPLVIYLVYKDRSPRVREAAAGAFNFTVTLWVANVVAFLLLFTIILIPISIVLYLASAIGLFVFHIWGAINAANDQPFKYPFQVPILK